MKISKVFLTLLQHCNRPSLDAPLYPLPAAVQLIGIFLRFGFFRFHNFLAVFSPFVFPFFFDVHPLKIKPLVPFFAPRSPLCAAVFVSVIGHVFGILCRPTRFVQF